VHMVAVEIEGTAPDVGSVHNWYAI
jgi:hypothetical protein